MDYTAKLSLSLQEEQLLSPRVHPSSITCRLEAGPSHHNHTSGPRLSQLQSHFLPIPCRWSHRPHLCLIPFHLANKYNTDVRRLVSLVSAVSHTAPGWPAGVSSGYRCLTARSDFLVTGRHSRTRQTTKHTSHTSQDDHGFSYGELGCCKPTVTFSWAIYRPRTATHCPSVSDPAVL